MQYQTVRFTLLNHKSASAESVLYSLNFLIEKKLIHKEWKHFEFDLLSHYHQELTRQKPVFLSEEAKLFQNQFLTIDSVLGLLDLLESQIDQFNPSLTIVKRLQLFHLERILSEMEVDQAMIDEFVLYDQLVSNEWKAKLFTHLDEIYEQVDTPEEVVSVVMEWYNLFSLTQESNSTLQ